MNYEPLAVIGTQIVAGTNYCFLCNATGSYLGAETDEALGEKLREDGIVHEEGRDLEAFPCENLSKAPFAEDGVGVLEVVRPCKEFAAINKSPSPTISNR